MKALILLFVLVLCTRLPAYTCEPQYDFIFRWVEGLRGDQVTEADYRQLRIFYLGRPYPVLNGTYIFTRDFNNSDTCQLQIHKSATGDTYGTYSPYPSDKIPATDFFNKYYREYAQLMFDGKTNFPNIPPEGLDYVPKGNYYIKAAKEQDMHYKLPDRLLLGNGFYRIDTIFRNHKGQHVGGLRLVFEAANKLPPR